MSTTPAVGRPSSTTEHWRPTAHFTTAQHWLNDPNGLLYRDGTWHLFFQTNPHGSTWGEIGWGHATSTDLHTWTEQPLAIPADAEEMVFSGSAVADVHDSAGLGDGDSTTLVAAYTSAYRGPSARVGTQAQSLAFSTDDGATWRRHDANPVLDLGLADFRDPKVFRYGGRSGHWVMVVAFPHEWRVGLYTSTDLLHWEPATTIDGVEGTDGIWECPDLLRVPVRSGGGYRWIALVSVFEGGPTGGVGVKYLVGDFDGRNFAPDRPGDWRWLDHGHDYYAAATFNDAPDGRAVVIAWATSPHYAGRTPTAPWRGAMSLACDLELAPGADGALSLRRAPVLPVEGVGIVVHDVSVPCLPGTRTVLELRAAGGESKSHVVLTLDGDDATLRVDRIACGPDDLGDHFQAPATAPVPRGETIDLRIVVDGCVLEIYAADGMVAFTEQIFPDAPLTELVTHPPAQSADAPDTRGEEDT